MSGRDRRRVAAVRPWARKECVPRVHDDGKDDAVGQDRKWVTCERNELTSPLSALLATFGSGKQTIESTGIENKALNLFPSKFVFHANPVRRDAVTFATHRVYACVFRWRQIWLGTAGYTLTLWPRRNLLWPVPNWGPEPGTVVQSNLIYCPYAPKFTRRSAQAQISKATQSRISRPWENLGWLLNVGCGRQRSTARASGKLELVLKDLAEYRLEI